MLQYLQNGYTSLHCAAGNGHSEIVQLLLTAGATDSLDQVGMSVYKQTRLSWPIKTCINIKILPAQKRACRSSGYNKPNNLSLLVIFCITDGKDSSGQSH